MDLHVSLGRRGRLAADVYEQLRAAILDGRLRAGERLPATRELAERLEVSRNTVLDAYARLTAEGFLAGRIGAGTFVTASQPVQRAATPASPLRPRPHWRGLAWKSTERRGIARDFSVGAPDPALFPWDEWRR